MLALLAGAGGLAGCKPPPTDAAAARVTLEQPGSGPSDPLPSPDTAGAVWARTENPLRLVFGVPGQPVLLALECVGPAGPEALLAITRHAPADDGAAALLALIGNRVIGRLPVDATMIGGRMLWRGDIPARAPGWNALLGDGEITATVPGAGLVRMGASPLPGELLEQCRGAPAPPTVSPLP